MYRHVAVEKHCRKVRLLPRIQGLCVCVCVRARARACVRVVRAPSHVTFSDSDNAITITDSDKAGLATDSVR